MLFCNWLNECKSYRCVIVFVKMIFLWIPFDGCCRFAFRLKKCNWQEVIQIQRVFLFPCFTYQLSSPNLLRDKGHVKMLWFLFTFSRVGFLTCSGFGSTILPMRRSMLEFKFLRTKRNGWSARKLTSLIGDDVILDVWPFEAAETKYIELLREAFWLDVYANELAKALSKKTRQYFMYSVNFTSSQF